VLSTYHGHTRHLVSDKLQQLEKVFEILKNKGHRVSIVEQKFNLDLTDYYNLSVDEWEKLMHEKRAKASMANRRDTENYWINLDRRRRRYGLRSDCRGKLIVYWEGTVQASIESMLQMFTDSRNLRTCYER
jgi:hypothetical protein